MAAVVRPPGRVAAARRRAFLWLPMLVAGVLVSAAGDPMIVTFNGADVVSVGLMVAGLLGVASEVGK